MKPRRFVALLAAVLVALPACGGEPAKAPRKEAGPDWGDVWSDTPEIYAVVRPQALKNDRTFGSFWRALVRAAQARGFASGASMVEAAEGAQEIIVGLGKGGAAVVLRGVPARLDPASIQGEDHRPLFRLASDERKKVAEYAANDPKLSDGSLFVLPDRTWVGALGPARERARGAFAAPEHRPHIEVSASALAVVRLSGGFLRLFERHRVLGPLTKKLTSVTMELLPGTGGLVIALAYSASDATAYGEMQAKKIASELGSDKDRSWLKDAKIQYEGDTVFVRVAIPPRLLEELPNASGSDLGL